MVDETLKYKIGITLIKGIGNNLAKNLIAYVGSAEGVFSEKKQHLAKIPGIGETLSSEIVSQNVLARAEQEIEFIEKNKIQPFYFTDRDYPFRLKECADSPIMIYTKGNCDLNAGKFVGIVGTRNATETGKENCKQLIADLAAAQPNTIIVSGLAYGVDICAHKAALDYNLPTIGVVGHGLDRIYPAAHRPTAVKMLQDGALLTEYLSQTNPDRQNFVQRNRIIAGLCDATVVIESAIKGGALITAEAANDYNRDVFTFPGRVTDEWSAGCNALIKNNKASLIESADDLLRFMNWEKQNVSASSSIQTALFLELSDEEQTVVSVLRQHTDGLQLNELSILLEKPVSRISSMLLEMEFKGVVKCLPGNLYKIIK
ncbi:DNA protecting protein DprA [Paludibacter propionicigenes WB4]|uniref:DNA protecting protein DprA n=1 Tax=Paludibacter propionicigenes (strain DSM 17365 / JCM 13257 / WB4) TaxID=694427 RepID=E4T647_PALPW|nr:DNA-processing protein DprA [Paludibacter propionicigenes]ADQ80191.1 DNA protecting protein DprA [Paludibacter propionicigenes WB4]